MLLRMLTIIDGALWQLVVISASSKALAGKPSFLLFAVALRSFTTRGCAAAYLLGQLPSFSMFFLHQCGHRDSGSYWSSYTCSHLSKSFSPLPRGGPSICTGDVKKTGSPHVGGIIIHKDGLSENGRTHLKATKINESNGTEKEKVFCFRHHFLVLNPHTLGWLFAIMVDSSWLPNIFPWVVGMLLLRSPVKDIGIPDLWSNFWSFSITNPHLQSRKPMLPLQFLDDSILVKLGLCKTRLPDLHFFRWILAIWRVGFRKIGLLLDICHSCNWLDFKQSLIPTEDYPEKGIDKRATHTVILCTACHLRKESIGSLRTTVPK